jgi:YbbR domain-containing protein
MLGTLLWFTVSGQQAERTVPNVPVVYVNKPDGLVITEQTAFVEIHVRGLDSQLRTIQPRDFEARVDLSNARPGAHSHMIRTDQVSVPLGLEVTQVDPGSVMTVLELAGSANLPVRVSIEGQPAEGFAISEMSVEPASVTVLGPARRISSTTFAVTDGVDIDGATATLTRNVGIGVSDPALRLREARTARVIVRIEKAGERPFAAARIALRNLEPGLRGHAEPAVVAVRVSGAESLLARLDAASIAPYVDVTGLGRGRHEVPVQIDPRGTLVISSVRPAQVTVVIQ